MDASIPPHAPPSEQADPPGPWRGAWFASLGLRTRFALFFGLIAGGAVGALLAAGVIGARRMGPESTPDVTFMLLLAGSAIVSLVIWVAFKFDEHVARPICQLAADVQVAVHADPGHDSGHTAGHAAGRYLGLLAPALAQTKAALRQSRCEQSQAIQAAMASARRQTRRLEAVIRDLDSAVLVCSLVHEVLLYNRRAAAAFALEGRLGLGRSVAVLIERAALEAAAQDLIGRYLADAASGAVATYAADLVCRTASKAQQVRGRMSLVFDPEEDRAFGYVLMLDEPLPLERNAVLERPEFYDFDTADRSASRTAFDTPLRQLAICVFDTETTGLDPVRGDALVSIAGVRLVNGRVLSGETFDTLVHPGRPIPAAATRIHGVTDAMVIDAPSPHAALRQFHDFVGEAVLCAHNAAFDLAFIAKGEIEAGVRFDQPVLDTVLIAAHVFGQDSELTLDALAERFGVAFAPQMRHTARGDAIATALVLTHLIALLEAQGIQTLGAALDVCARQTALRRAQSRYRAASSRVRASLDPKSRT